MESKSVWKGLAYGGFASCIADIFTLPVDVTKTRLQLSGEGGQVRAYKGAIDCAFQTAKKEGITALWKGLEPALWRQATYGSMRYGFYAPIKDYLAPGVPKSELPLYYKILSGALSGAIASAMCNPTDLVKVRMMADGMDAQKPGAKPRYRWAMGAMIEIARAEGVLGLWKGTGPTCARATVLAAAELASYDQIKQIILDYKLMQEGISLHFTVAIAAGFFGSLACNPFDVAKSRVMNQPAAIAGVTPKYSGMLDCMGKTVQHEGITSLWKGFIPAWARVGPRVVIVFIIMEQLKMRFG